MRRCTETHSSVNIWKYERRSRTTIIVNIKFAKFEFFGIMIFTKNTNFKFHKIVSAAASASKRQLHWFFAAQTPPHFYSARQGAEYCDQFVCVCVCLSSSISLEPLDRSSQKFVLRSPVAVARSSSGGVAICYVFLVLWMTSCSAAVGHMAMRG